MVKSLRWRIQFWYSILFGLILLGFSAFVYARMRIQVFEQIDLELVGAGQSLVAVLRSVPPEDLDRGPSDRPFPRPPPEDRPPPPGRRGRPDRGWRNKLELPIGFADRNSRATPFFVVWQGAEVLAKSREAPAPSEIKIPTAAIEQRPYFYSQRELRTVAMRGPKGTAVAVGRHIDRELAELDRWLLLLLGNSAVIFVLGSVGGAWLSRRALEPLKSMSNSAAAISAENLSQRIDVTSVDLELADLAETLNNTFARLEAAFLRQANFTADASHELRTPLTIIFGHLERILSREKLTGDSAEAIQACFRAAKRMKSLIEQLLLLARADAGKLNAQSEVFDLRAVVEEVVDLLIPLGAQKNVVVKAELEPVEVVGDPQLLSQVVLNLITNGIQHHPGQGEVRIHLHAENGTAILQVTDDGPGIAADCQPQLFQRFFRADASRARSSGGSGLGLAIAQAIAQGHGGNISCESVVDQGSCFTLRLPTGTPSVAT